MHKAYFDILKEQLNSDPPEYKQALILLEDVKQVHIFNQRKKLESSQFKKVFFLFGC